MIIDATDVEKIESSPADFENAINHTGIVYYYIIIMMYIYAIHLYFQHAVIISKNISLFRFLLFLNI